MIPRLRAIFLLSLIFHGFPSGSAAAHQSASATKEEWVKKLSQMTIHDYEMMRQFAALDPEFTYSVFREVWPQLTDGNLKDGLLDSFLTGNADRVNGVQPAIYQPSPRLLDMMAIVLAETPDSSANKLDARPATAKETVRSELLGIAFQEISGPEDLKRWRAAIGNRPLATVIREGSERVVNVLKTGSVVERLKTLELLRKITYYRSIGGGIHNGVKTREYEAAGVMSMFRNALLEAKLPDALGGLLRPDIPVQVRRASVRVFARLQPGEKVVEKYEPEFQRELPRILERPAILADDANPRRSHADLVRLLGAFGGDWATDTLVSLLRSSLERGESDDALIEEIQYCNNPRVIPALIGLLDSERIVRGVNPYESTLIRIAELRTVPDNSGHDFLWWRLWWRDYKKKFPPAIQNLPIQLTRKANVAAMDSLALVSRPRVERAYISQDPKRSYWLISPVPAKSELLTEKERIAVSNSGTKVPAMGPPERPGLLLLLMDQDTEAAEGLESWLDLSNALAGRYWLAIAIRPGWTGNASADRWPTRQDASTVHGAALATETFAEQIVGQVQVNAAIDPARIYLVAEGNSGLAGYSCGLQKATPFNGFCLLSAPFRSPLLPPAFSAKARKFYLAIGLEHSGAADALAVAAVPLLNQQGAIVFADRQKSGSIQESILRGVRWLER